MKSKKIKVDKNLTWISEMQCLFFYSLIIIYLLYFLWDIVIKYIDFWFFYIGGSSWAEKGRIHH